MFLFSRPPKVLSSVVAILGMHRSGTSCLAGSLQQKGMFLGEVPEWNEHNRKGNRENQAIAELNEDVLNYSGGSWHQPPPDIKWKRPHAKRRNEIIAEFESGNHAVWGFKDPRVTLNLSFWQDAIPDLKFAGTFRHPTLVAQSLLKRDQMPIEYALNVWRSYNERMVKLYARQAFPIISFDLDQANYLANIERMSKELELPDPQGEDFLDAALKSAGLKTTNDDSLPAEIRTLLTSLEEANQKTLGR